MRERFRNSMAWLHTWTGLIVGWVLFFMFLTGTSGYFNDEISRWMKPELPLKDRSAATISPSEGFPITQAFLQENAPHAETWGMDVPHPGHEHLSVWWMAPEGEKAKGGRRRRSDVNLDPATGGRLPELKPRQTGGGGQLYRMHYGLHYIPFMWARYVAGFCAMVMLVALITGVITHRRFFKDFFTFRPGKGPAPWMDGHAVLGVIALPFLLMITYSGLVFFLYTYLPFGMKEHYDGNFGSYNEALSGLSEAGRGGKEDKNKPSGVSATLGPLSEFVDKSRQHWPDGAITGIRVDHPGDSNALVTLFRLKAPPGGTRSLAYRAATGELLPPEPERGRGFASEVQGTLLTLHRGHFGGYFLRWLYFGSGLLGCGLIATGLILWTVKRRAKNARQGASFGQQLVERLNIGAIAGLPAGFAAYFWANRLIPADWPERGRWEINTLFITWAVLLVYPAFRPVLRGWREELALTGILFSLLPVLNFSTTDRHLGITLPAGDWELAGFDLTVLALGLLFLQASRGVAQKQGALRREAKKHCHENSAPASPV